MYILSQCAFEVISINIYEVKYYGSNNDLVYTNYFTIIKKKLAVKKQEKSSSTVNIEEENIISDEANIN